jgi:dipeptidyl-peptidase-4
MKRALGLSLGIGLAVTSLGVAQDGTLTVERVWGGDEFTSELTTIEWMADGTSYTYVTGEDTTDLYRVDARSGAERLLVSGATLVPMGATESIAIEEYEFSPDLTKLLVYTNSVRVWRQNTKGEYYLWDFQTGQLTPLSTAPGYQQFAKFSPDGRYVGWVRENNIFVRDLATGEELQLTHDGSQHIINGTGDWVYEEELSLQDAFRFSPDGSRIAFWRLDQTVIEPFYLIDETTLYPTLMPVRYPKAGSENSEVRIGVVEIAGGATNWIDVGSETDIYIADMDFAGTSTEMWFTRLNRHQSRLDLLLADVGTGSSRVIMTDEDEAWVEQEEPRWFDGGRQFLFISERDGYRQVYLHRRDGTVVRKVTTGGWDVTSVLGVDERNDLVYFTGSVDGALTRPLYSIGLNGRGLHRVSAEGGTHTVQFNPTYTMYVDRSSTAAEPPVQRLHEANGQPIRTVEANEDLAAAVAALGLAAPEFITLAGDDGTVLNGLIMKPRDFDPNRAYPLLMHVYGGPGSQRVTDRWDGQRYLWHQLMVQRGYLVAIVDNRGTGARGRDFKKQTYLKLGQYETADQIAAARYLASLPYVDGGRVGMWGWSYGGYMSLLTLFQGADVFKAAISVAPVSDWRLYDTIYTERFMRTPQENPEGYELGSPVTYADRLEGNLLIVHGTGDDNVHSQNTTQLIQRLQEAGKQFDMRLYPNKTHSIRGGNARENLYGYFTRWLMENL